MTREELAAMHAERWPWCSLPIDDGYEHTHEDRAGEAHHVNGRPAGPMLQLRGRVIRP